LQKWSFVAGRRRMPVLGASQSNMNKNIFKSLGAVLAGIVAGAVLSIGTDLALAALHIFPPLGSTAFLPWMLGVALFYRCVYTVASGYITAMLAPQRPMRHVVILGMVGILVSAVGVVAGWKLSEHWYPIALVIIALPCAWLGGKLRIHKR
jgi:hypothetical protein